MAANWNNPTLSSSYTDFLANMKARDEDAAVQFSIGSPTNMPTGAVKWDTGLNRWQKWSGSAWGELATTYALTGVTATSLSVTGNTTLGDAGADSVTFNAATVTFANSTAIAGALTFSGSIGFTGNVTLGDAVGDSVTVNAGSVVLRTGGVTFSNGLANFTAGLQVSGVAVITAASADTLTNKAYNAAVGGNVLKVNGNTITAGAGTGTITIPTATDTLVGRATTDTMTNKTLTAPTINDPTFGGSGATFGSSFIVPVVNGGTGADNGPDALTNLGISWLAAAEAGGVIASGRASAGACTVAASQNVSSISRTSTNGVYQIIWDTGTFTDGNYMVFIGFYDAVTPNIVFTVTAQTDTAVTFRFQGGNASQGSGPQDPNKFFVLAVRL